MSVLNKKLTFCLFFILLGGALPAKANLKFNSTSLQRFYNSIVSIKTARLSGEEYCKLHHQKITLNFMTKFALQRVDDSTLVKKSIVAHERNDTSFWDSNGLKIDPSKLYTLEEIISSGIFNNMPNVLDNVYCFPFLGAGYEDAKDRKKVVNALERLKPSLNPYVYYSDGYSTGTDSVLNAYFLDSSSKEILALKVIITD